MTPESNTPSVPLFSENRLDAFESAMAVWAAAVKEHGDQTFPCAVCGTESTDWDDNAGELRCGLHHIGGREQDRTEKQ